MVSADIDCIISAENLAVIWFTKKLKEDLSIKVGNFIAINITEVDITTKLRKFRVFPDFTNGNKIIQINGLIR